ncbi:MAG: amino acid ABC transporter ATP-binding protein [Oscillospiraceae bacterium]|jgi:polar amino acid transport system ATP-binding protein|nr:amino acid ABC transporter ATP-binding protein [Oscillospiraceae bacterium]
MNNPLIQAIDICKSFGSLEVLKHVNLEVGKGEVVGIIGPSGAGKSTFLRALNHLETITSGKIIIDGQILDDRENGVNRSKLSKQSETEILLEMGMVFQRFNIFPHKTVLENVMLAPMHVRKLPKTQAAERAKELIAAVGLTDKLDVYPAKLSGGQLQRVAIARALAMNPTIMLFDEPTSALDPELVGEVLGVMRKLASDGMTMLIVTHEIAFAREVAKKIIFMSEGMVLEEGSPRELFENAKNEKTRAFLNAVL